MPLKSSPSDKSLLEVLKKRRSKPVVGERPCSLERLAAVIDSALGSTGTAFDEASQVKVPLRAYPSAGALYPCAAYVLLLNVSDQEAGLSVVDRTSDHLVFLSRLPKERLVEPFFGMSPIVSANAVVIVTADVGRARKKYGPRAGRFAILEAGHMCQNVCLAAEAEGLSALPWGGFFDDEVRSLLELKGEEQPVAAVVISSHRPTP